MIDENELLFDELYEKTKDFGRTQFIKLLMSKERENQELKKQLEEYQNLIKNLKQLELYEYNLDYDYEENPIDDYQSFDMDYYIDNYLKIERLNEEETKNERKEFIEYMENEINKFKELEKFAREVFDNNKIINIELAQKTIEENNLLISNFNIILQRFKEIIG